MPLTLEEVQHIAELARLQLSSEELERYRGQLSSILDHVAQLQKLDTTGIAPTSSVLPGRSVLREDVPGESLSPGGSPAQYEITGKRAIPRAAGFRGAGWLNFLSFLIFPFDRRWICWQKKRSRALN